MRVLERRSAVALAGERYLQFDGMKNRLMLSGSVECRLRCGTWCLFDGTPDPAAADADGDSNFGSTPGSLVPLPSPPLPSPPLPCQHTRSPRLSLCVRTTNPLWDFGASRSLCDFGILPFSNRSTGSTTWIETVASMRLGMMKRKRHGHRFRRIFWGGKTHSALSRDRS